jgi:drug/metabolite transporter (DMT)-like permease
MISIILMYAISASTFLFSKQLLLHCSPFFLLGVRTLCAGTIFLSISLCVVDNLFAHIKKNFFSCVAIAFSSFYVSNFFKFWALNSVTAVHGASIFLIEPLVAAVCAWMMFNERVSRMQLLGVLVCMCGALALDGSYAGLFGPWFTVPGAVMFGSVLFSVYGALLMRKLIFYQRSSVIVVNGLSMTIAGICALLTTLFETTSCTVIPATSFSFFGNVVAMIVLSNIIGYSLYGYALKRYSVLLISCGSFLRPFFVMIYKSLFLHEAGAWHTMYAAALVACGLVLVYKDECMADGAQEKIALKN